MVRTSGPGETKPEKPGPKAEKPEELKKSGQGLAVEEQVASHLPEHSCPQMPPEGNDRAAGALDILVVRRQPRLRQLPGCHGNRTACLRISPLDLCPEVQETPKVW